MTKHKAEFQEGRGYTREDWDAVSDPHETTPEQAAQRMTFKEAMAEASTRGRGRPRVENPLAAVTLRIHPETVERFKAQGKDWRARMAAALEQLPRAAG